MEEKECLPDRIHTQAHRRTHKSKWKVMMKEWSTLAYRTVIAVGVTFLATDSSLVDIFCLEVVTSYNMKNRETYGTSPLNGKLSMLLTLHLHSLGSLYYRFAWSLHLGCHSQESAPATVSGNYAQVARTHYVRTSKEQQLAQRFCPVNSFYTMIMCTETQIFQALSSLHIGKNAEVLPILSTDCL